MNSVKQPRRSSSGDSCSVAVLNVREPLESLAGIIGRDAIKLLTDSPLAGISGWPGVFWSAELHAL